MNISQLLIVAAQDDNNNKMCHTYFGFGEEMEEDLECSPVSAESRPDDFCLQLMMNSSEE